MPRYRGKYESAPENNRRHCPWALIPLFFFLVELFGWCYLRPKDGGWWILLFGVCWALILSGILRLLPAKIGRVGFALLALGSLVYSVGQTGYYLLFSEMMWLSDFRYASEGAGYVDIVTNFPAHWFLWIPGLLLMAIFLVRWYPKYRLKIGSGIAVTLVTAAAVFGACQMPGLVFEQDEDIKYSGSDYGRAQSAEAAYENLFNPHRLYQVCGLYQTAAKDFYTHSIYPLSPAYAQEREQLRQEIDLWFSEQKTSENNAMTGVLADKNVVLVLMESMDDWMIGEHTPTLCRLMEEGINFTNFYTPAYGGIRTFNTEFCLNTGSFLSSAGGFAFDYVTNSFDHSLANLLRQSGYSAKLFHYNDPVFYSRGVYSEALGYEEYVCYADYVEETDEKKRKKILYDDLLLFDNPELRQEFFREEDKTFNFVITRSAHLSYKYNEVLSYWALKKYPEYKGLTGSEETDCALVKARLVDDFFARLLAELEAEGQLENTVIIGVTDHYTYGYKNTEELLQLSQVSDTLLLEKTPCFIWSPGLEAAEVEKTLNTSDLLPTVLNLLGIQSPYRYMGHDAFDPDYPGFALFSNGSWITETAAYDASARSLLNMGPGSSVSKEYQAEMSKTAAQFTRINNKILEADYYNTQ